MKGSIPSPIWLRHPSSTLTTTRAGWIIEGQKIKDLPNPGLNWIVLIHVDHQLLMTRNVFLPLRHPLHPRAVLAAVAIHSSVVPVPHLSAFLSTY